MSDYASGGSSSPRFQSFARRRFGAGWEAAKRVAFFIILVLIMLVPLDMVDGIVLERAATKAQVEEEIGAQWGPTQIVSGPLLVVPYETQRVRTTAAGEQKTFPETHYAVFTPDALDIKARSDVQKRHKSIYEMLVYGADVTVSGHFATPDFAAHGIAADKVKWQQASLVLGISGVRAVNAISLAAAGSDRELEAGVPDRLFGDGVTAALPLQSVGAGPLPFEFTYKLNLNGRDELAFQPLGRQTAIAISSGRPHPNFIGTPLPAKHDISAEGF